MECNPIGMRVCASAQRRSWQKCARHRQGWVVCAGGNACCTAHNKEIRDRSKKEPAAGAAGQEQRSNKLPTVIIQIRSGPHPGQIRGHVSRAKAELRFPGILFIYFVFFPQPHQVPSSCPWWRWCWRHRRGRWRRRLMILGAEGRKPCGSIPLQATPTLYPLSNWLCKLNKSRKVQAGKPSSGKRMR